MLIQNIDLRIFEKSVKKRSVFGKVYTGDVVTQTHPLHCKYTQL